MKNTTALLALLIANCTAFGQTVTTDSTVQIPRRWMRKATVELLRYDDCREEISLLKPRVAAQEKVISALAKDTLLKAERIDFLGAQIQSERITSAMLETNCNAQLHAWQKASLKAKRKSTSEAVLIGIGAFATGYLFHSFIR